jgi:glucan phosphoethanolaminetransferase (alkaline phosphatase superfamily)
MPGTPGRRTLALDRRSEPTVRETTMFILLALILVLVVMVAFWPARVARRKGHSFFLFFLLSLVFFPLALVLAYVVDDRAGLVYDV